MSGENEHRFQLQRITVITCGFDLKKMRFVLGVFYRRRIEFCCVCLELGSFGEGGGEM